MNKLQKEHVRHATAHATALAEVELAETKLATYRKHLEGLEIDVEIAADKAAETQRRSNSSKGIWGMKANA